MNITDEVTILVSLIDKCIKTDITWIFQRKWHFATHCSLKTKQKQVTCKSNMGTSIADKHI